MINERNQKAELYDPKRAAAFRILLDTPDPERRLGALRNGIHKLSKGHGISLINEFEAATEYGNLVGGITVLPEIDFNARPDGLLPGVPSGIRQFLKTYLYHHVGTRRKDLLQEGHIRLGNNDQETRELISWLDEQGLGAEYYDWVFKYPKAEEALSYEYRRRQKAGILKKLEI